MAILTQKHIFNQINLIYDDIINGKNRYYIFVGRPLSWTNEASPDVISNAIFDCDQNVYTDMVYGKLIQPSKVSKLAKRINWTSGVKYDNYDQNDGNLYSKNYYVITTDFNVYKCIYNNNTVSTVKPTLTDKKGVFETSDGYVWKYLYSISSDDFFLSTEYIPIKEDSVVKQNAVSGSIDHIRIDNDGWNYETYHTSFLRSFINKYTLQLPETAHYVDNYYTNSSIFLKSGLGSGQIAKIANYDGLNRRVYLTTPLKTYVNFELSDISGSFGVIGNQVKQDTFAITIDEKRGTFNLNDTIIQSDTLATATVVRANSSIFVVKPTNNTAFLSDYYCTSTAQSPSLMTGNVSVSLNSTNVIGNGTSFNTQYAVGETIQIGNTTHRNIRKIISVTNNTLMTISTPLGNNQTIVGSSHYKPYDSFYTSSVTRTTASGPIVFSDLNSVKIKYNNNDPDKKYIGGEFIQMTSNTGIEQPVTGTVSFSNSSLVILTNVSGTFINGNKIKGKTSNKIEDIVSIIQYPTVTIETENREFLSGLTVDNINADGSSTGTAKIVSYYTIPNELTEYVISPTVVIEGDGEGAQAYSEVSIRPEDYYSISKIIMFNTGKNYSYANISLQSNTLHGNGAILSAVIAPTSGHGGDVQEEINGSYLGIKVDFDAAINESYRYPIYGSYRKIGILRNPIFNQCYINIANMNSTTLTISNASGLFTSGETIKQPTSNTTGIIIHSNSSVIIANSVLGTFATGNIFGTYSNTTAYVNTANINNFRILFDQQQGYQYTSNTNFILDRKLTNTILEISNISGKLTANAIIHDPTTNSYGIVDKIYSTSNADLTTSFGTHFNQYDRISLSFFDGNFTIGETITQDITKARGTLINKTDEIDCTISGVTGNLINGSILTNSLTGNAVIISANSSYVKLSGKQGSWAESISFTTSTGATGNIDTIHSVLIVNNVKDKFENGQHVIRGSSSNAQALSAYSNTINRSQLVRNSGDVLYIDNTTAFNRNRSSKEAIELVIKY